MGKEMEERNERKKDKRGKQKEKKKRQSGRFNLTVQSFCLVCFLNTSDIVLDFRFWAQPMPSALTT